MIADAEYEFIRQLVYERSRISLGPDKKVLVAARLAKRLRKLNLESYSDYCRLLKSGQGEDELFNLVDVISTNHTHFFREIKHFEFLERTVLPTWKPVLQRDRTPFRLWSAASSTGEEPYSLAISLAEALGPASMDWHIDATDISTRVLTHAQNAIYEKERLGEVKPELLRKHFQRGVGEWEGHCRIKQELRDRVTFHHLNLLQPSYPFSTPFHTIFCRNVMIYFDRPTQETLINKLSSMLLPGGYLMVGHSESLSGIRHSLKSVCPAVYLKP